ncbi:MAG TPA: hypothetical protein PK954_08150 [Anaerolineales bacterium]|nr:hypothetical protein [Anaerolineales bacterium]
MAALETLNRFRLDRTFMDSVTAWERQPARPAREAPFPQGLDGRLATALAGQGIQRLYTHQAAAAAAALGGAHVVTVTGTASGKTLGYNLPWGIPGRAPCTCSRPRRWRKTRPMSWPA